MLIEVTQLAQEARKLWIVSHNIESMIKVPDGYRISMSSGTEYYIKESPEEINKKNREAAHGNDAELEQAIDRIITEAFKNIEIKN